MPQKEKPQDWMVDFHETIPDSSFPPKSGEDPFIMAMRDAYYIRFSKMDQTAVLKEVMVNLKKADDRHDFNEGIKGLSHIEFAKKAAKVLAYQTKKPNSSIPISLKKEELIRGELTARMAAEMKVIHEGLPKKKPIAIGLELDSDKVKRHSYQETLDSIIIDEDDIPTRVDGARHDIDLAVLVPEDKRKTPIRQETILPSPVNNLSSGVSGIQSAKLPKEEEQFGRLTKRELKVSIEADPFKAPPPGSDHSALRMEEHMPDSGRYSFTPPPKKKK